MFQTTADDSDDSDDDDDDDDVTSGSESEALNEEEVAKKSVRVRLDVYVNQVL